MRLIYKFIFWSFLALLNLKVIAQKYEAEKATLSNGANVVSNAQSSDGAYVAMEGGQLSFQINLEQSGVYNIYINAASPYGEKINIFSLNNSTIDFKLTQNIQFINKQVVSTHYLKEGSYHAELLPSWGYINIDYIEFEKTTEEGNRFDLNQSPVNPEATAETIALYDFLLDNYGEKIISGVMTLASMDESDWLLENTGKEPALLGIDFMHSGRGYTWYDDETPINDATEWYERNGIPALMWHWRDPSKITEEFYSGGTSFDVSKILDENSSEYKAMVEDIDYISGLLLKLQEQNVPVLWRPLHEAAGGWFWWGAKGPEPAKRLYQLMYDRMVNHHGLNNLLWIWTREPNDETWYPGDDLVDIVGRDIYRTGNHSTHAFEFSNMNELYNGKKMITLSEVGSFPDPDLLQEEAVAWSWFMPWYGDHTRNPEYNPLSLWEKALKHDYVITLDEMPVLRTYVRENTDPVTGIKNDSYLLSLYPTFVTDIATIESSALIRSVEVYNSTGVLIMQSEPKAHKAEISLKVQPPGIYLVRINKVETKRVIKK